MYIYEYMIYVPMSERILYITYHYHAHIHLKAVFEYNQNGILCLDLN